MNLKIPKMKISFIILLLFVSVSALFADSFPMQIELVRSFDADNKTGYDINFFIPYSSITFEKGEQYFVSEVYLDFSIKKADKVIYNDVNTFQIAVSNEPDTKSDSKGYLDKLHYSFDKKDISFVLEFVDSITNNSFLWEVDLSSLPEDAQVGDMEISSNVIPAKSEYLKKFQRDGFTYRVEPAHIINLEETDNAYLYFSRKPGFSVDDLKLKILKKDELFETVELELDPNGSFPIDFKKFPVGYYDIQLIDKDDKVLSESYVVLKKLTSDVYNVFSKLEDEYTLMKYYGNSNTISRWNRLSSDMAKKRFATKFWTHMAMEKEMEIEDYIQMLRVKVNEASAYDYRFKKGWETDRGRVFLRNGAPDIVINGKTQSNNTAYTRKDYQVWEYADSEKGVYLFLDIQMNGNYKFLYATQDDKEVIDPNWKDYMGPDFDIYDAAPQDTKWKEEVEENRLWGHPDPNPSNFDENELDD